MLVSLFSANLKLMGYKRDLRFFLPLKKLSKLLKVVGLFLLYLIICILFLTVSIKLIQNDTKLYNADNIGGLYLADIGHRYYQY